MKSNKILGVTITSQSKKSILEKILKYTTKKHDFVHIVSLNPENLVIATENIMFKKALSSAPIKIIDGVGVILAAQILNITHSDRYTGVELMTDIVRRASERRLRVMLIGGKPNLAMELAECYQKQYSKAKFFGLMGIKDIKNPKKSEEDEIFSIVAARKPHIILAAFGSPNQELWFERNKERLDNTIGIGVGGAFDFLSQRVKRAPVIIQQIGFEWLYRLITQPWRIKRQLRLIKFGWLVIQQKGLQ